MGWHHKEAIYSDHLLQQPEINLWEQGLLSMVELLQLQLNLAYSNLEKPQVLVALEVAQHSEQEQLEVSLVVLAYLPMIPMPISQSI